jgi:hypothetical protein
MLRTDGNSYRLVMNIDFCHLQEVRELLIVVMWKFDVRIQPQTTYSLWLRGVL